MLHLVAKKWLDVAFENQILYVALAFEKAGLDGLSCVGRVIIGI